MKYFYLAAGCVFLVSLAALSVAAMIQMSHPWEAPPWMGIAARGVCWSAFFVALLAIVQIACWYFQGFVTATFFGINKGR